MEATEVEGVFKLMKPKEKELVYVTKCDDEFDRNGFTWQPFRRCDRWGVVKNQRYHYCCSCGYYLIAAKKNKLSFNTTHEHDPFDDGDINPPADIGDESDAPQILLYHLIRYICHSNPSFVQASSKFLTALVREAIILGRIFKDVEPEILFPELSSAKLSENVNIMGYNKKDRLLDELFGQQVSILLDAGKSLPFYE
jgi:hypothetical protein